MGVAEKVGVHLCCKVTDERPRIRRGSGMVEVYRFCTTLLSFSDLKDQRRGVYLEEEDTLLS